MKFADLVLAVADETGVPRGDVNATLRAAHEKLLEAIATQDRVAIAGLGAFIAKVTDKGDKRILFKPAK